jgi:hypothetical protein
MHYHITQETEFDENGRCVMRIQARGVNENHEWTNFVGDPRERVAFYQRCGCTASFERSTKLPGAMFLLAGELDADELDEFDAEV